MFKIISPGPTGAGTKIFTPDGKEVPGVVSVEISKIDVNSINTAKIEVFVDIEVLADPVFALENIKQMASVHGYKLIPNGKKINS